jgi:urease accessory protein UreF
VADGSRGSDPIDNPAALDPRLMIWLSPAFPVGSFAYSHGLEWAAHVGTLTDRATLEDWIGDLITHGSLGTDMVLLAATWRAVMAGHDKDLRDVLELAAALQPTGERHLETTTQGHAFLAQIRAAWPCASVDHGVACATHPCATQGHLAKERSHPEDEPRTGETRTWARWWGERHNNNNTQPSTQART